MPLGSALPLPFGGLSVSESGAACAPQPSLVQLLKPGIIAMDFNKPLYGISVEDASRDNVIERRGLIRQLNIDLWEGAYNMITSDPTLEEVCVQSHTFPSAIEKDVPSIQWFLYRCNGTIWMRIVRYGRVVEQKPYESPVVIPRGVWVDDHKGIVARQLSTHHWDGSHMELEKNPEMQEIDVGLYNDYVDGEMIPSWHWLLYKHEGRIWSRTELRGRVVSQQPYTLNEEEYRVYVEKWHRVYDSLATEKN